MTDAVLPTRARSRARRLLAMLSSVVAATALMVGVPAADQAAVAADAANFDPGYIVSDANFYDGNALDANGVLLFLASKNPGCLPGALCIMNYAQNTPSMAATAYCQAMPGIANESAASIIARVGAACGISQKTLLVLLQKEQSLVTLREATISRFNKATGFACPDTAPCDPSYAGFFYQVYNAARQFQIYKARPQNFNYKAGQWNAILYHPNAACGTGNVFIQNAATAALYIYTPYRPNAAALANLYGTGDACSSYGNRNFWRMWTDWFGPPTQPPVSLARVPGSSDTWLLGLGVRYRFTSAEQLAQYARFGAVRDITSTDLANYYWDGRVVQRAVASTDGNVFLVDTWKFAFQSCDQVAAYGLSCSSLPLVSATQLVPVPSGGWLQSLAQGADGVKWLVQSGTRRETPDPTLLAPYGIPSSVSGLSATALGALPVGQPVTTTALYTDGAGSFRVVGGGSFGIPAGFLDASVTARAVRLQPASFAFLSGATALPNRVRSDGRSLVLTTLGWLQVDPVPYGGDTAFAAGPSGLWRSLPLQVAGSTYFVREQNGTQVYLLGRNGLLAVTDTTIAWYSSVYGVSATPVVVPDGSLADVPDALDAPVVIGPGTVPGPRG